MKRCLISLLSLCWICLSGIYGQKEDFYLGLGWNLGNQLDAYNHGTADETCWGNRKATQQTFDSLKAMHFTAVRIPVTWLGHIGPAPAFSLDEPWLERVAEIVNYAENAGLNAIINIHHDGAGSRHWLDIKKAAKDESVNERVKEQLRAVWTQIAERFKDKGHFLMFESMNEIHDGEWGWGENRTDSGRQYEVLNEWNQVFVDAIRNTGGKNEDRYLGVPGYCTNTELTLKHFRMPIDKVSNKILISIHYYEPYLFTLENQWNEWGKKALKNKGQNTDEQFVDSVFRSLKETYVDKGIQVYIGEFGCCRRADATKEHYRKYWLEYVCRSARRNGLSLFYWDNGSRGAGRECSGIVDHGTGEFISNGAEIVKIMMAAYHE